MSVTMTIRIDESLKERLGQLAEATDRSKSYLAAEALKEFVEINEWQVSEIKKAIRRADAGEFASEEEVQALRNKYS